MALYPPIVASSMPAFDVKSQEVKIYFTLSGYNSSRLDQISGVHVNVRNQYSNVNVLKSGYEWTYKQIQQDDQDLVFNRYYVLLTSTDVDFQADMLYKIQLRFVSNQSNNNAMIQQFYSVDPSFLTSNFQAYSEWSTVCILKPINAPLIFVDEFESYAEAKESNENVSVEESKFQYSLADFTGRYCIEESSESLKNYRMRLLSDAYQIEFKNNIQNYTLADTGIKTVSTYNYTINENAVVLQDSLEYEMKDNTKYKLLFEIETRNGFTLSKMYSFKCQYSNNSDMTGTLSTYINNQQGYIKLHWSNNNQKVTQNFVIRRCDSKHNFLKWEDLKIFQLTNMSEFDYYDFTVESGTGYRYLIQTIDIRGRRSNPLYDQTRGDSTDQTDLRQAIIPDWQHAFLLETNGNGDVTKARQLKLKYDFQISSYKTNISESKTDTIGSKYPYVRRNGQMYYRSFPITGTITSYMDNVELLTSPKDMYDNQQDIFEKYFNEDSEQFKSFSEYNYIHERKFREKVEQFLYNSKPKLYKSTQEGNIFIKLMEVSLTPKQELSRLIYTFSATAYEIGQASIENFNTYGFIDIGTYNTEISFQEPKIGQLHPITGFSDDSGIVFSAGYDIIGAGSAPAAATSIASQYNYKTSINGNILTDFYLSHLKLTIESEPYLIIEDSNGQLRPYLDTIEDSTDLLSPIGGDIKNPLYQMESTYSNQNGQNIYLGTLFNMNIQGNEQQIVISYPNNIYELKGDNIYLPASTTIIPAKDTVMSVDFLINLHYTTDTSEIARKITTEKKIGQIYGNYNNSLNLVTQILSKYTYTDTKPIDVRYTKIAQSVNGLLTFTIDTQPHTKIQVTTQNSPSYQIVVNETGELTFDPGDSITYITGIKILGKEEEQQDGTIQLIPQNVDALLFYTIELKKEYF